MKRLLSLFLFLMTAMLSFAHDFEAGGIYYKIISSITMTVKVTSGDTQYTGAVTIPSSVHYDGKTYSVTSIGGYAFRGCISLKSVNIPGSVTTIGNDAFSGCSGLTSITIPNSVTSIGGYAFYNCSGLTSITIPNSVTRIGGSAFEGCSGLTSVTFHCQEIGSSFSGMNIKEVILGEEVTSIGDHAFDECSGLTSVTIPNSVTTIGERAFSNCSGLTSITIGNSVTSIGRYAFQNCSGLKSVSIPNSVTTIGDWALSGCTGLTSVTIGNSVTIIGNYAFSGCSGLTSVTFHCQEIGSWFCGMNIKEVILGEEVTSIGDYAFSHCSGLTTVDIPNSVTSIGKFAFEFCSGMTSINIPNSVTSIGSGAFDFCSGLKKVIVPDLAAWCNISFDGDAANPLYCAKHIYSDENTEITDLVIPNSVTSIGDWAFSGCTGLTSVTIPNNVTKIGSGAFQNCSSLTSVNIPNSVTSIGSYAFDECSGLKSVSIPNSVTTIGDDAFSGCSGLKKITSYIQEPFVTFWYCWRRVNKSIPLYVPVGSKEKYQSTYLWQEFTNIIEFGGEHIETATEPTEVDMAAVPDQMDLNGMVVGDTYYVLDAENGDGADSENGCVVINTKTTDEAMEGIAGKDVSEASVKAVFKGIIFMVPAGTGTISITAETLGTSSLKVKIGSQAAQAFKLAERETVEIPYNVAEPTYVYIYAGTGIQAARSVGAARAAAAENSVKVYSYKWEPTDPTGINSVDNSQSATDNEAGDWYTIDGRKLSGKPAQKGIYIVNGRKVAVK